MKKFLLFLIISGVFACHVQSQDLHFGLKAGANFSNLNISSDNVDPSLDGATNFYIGALADMGISDKSHLQTEILYSIEGAQDAALYFLDFPVMYKYYLIPGLNLQLGPQLGILLDAENGTADLKSVNWSLNFGAAYELSGGFFVDARYNLGLTNFSLIELNDFSLKTQVFQLGVGYRF